MNRKICIISANCQGAYLKELLRASPQFDETYEIHYYVNYNREVVPDEMLAQCSLLIYQPLTEKWGELSADRLTSIVPADCHKIAVTYLTSQLYWPFTADDGRNTPDETYPFGQFPYGDSLLQELIGQGLDPDAVMDRYLQEEFIDSVFSPELVISSYVEEQADLESRRDQKLLDFIMENFRKVKLFESFNHPSRVLCIYQANDLLEKIGMLPLEEADIPTLGYLKGYEQPIHPLVADRLGLEFECENSTHYQIWGKPMGFLEYTRAYIEWDVASIGKIQVEPKKVVIPAGQASDWYGSLPKELQHPERQIFFVHIPKSAGSSLNQMLMEAYALPADYPHYNSTILLIKDPLRLKLPLLLGHIHYEVANTLLAPPTIFTFLREPIERTISAFEFMKANPETWLGQLAQGTISDFLNHEAVFQNENNVQTRMIGHEIPFPRLWDAYREGRLTAEQYFSNIQISMNQPATQKTLDLAKRRLESMAFFGFTETFGEDVEKLFQILGKTCPEVVRANITPEKFRTRDTCSEAEMDLILSANEYDIQLYEFAKSLRQTSPALS
jgi:hypothetical protein